MICIYSNFQFQYLHSQQYFSILSLHYLSIYFTLIYLTPSLSIPINLYPYLSLPISTYLSSLSISFSTYLSINLYISLSLSLYIYIYTYISISLFSAFQRRDLHTKQYMREEKIQVLMKRLERDLREMERETEKERERKVGIGR